MDNIHGCATRVMCHHIHVLSFALALDNDALKANACPSFHAVSHREPPVHPPTWPLSEPPTHPSSRPLSTLLRPLHPPTHRSTTHAWSYHHCMRSSCFSVDHALCRYYLNHSLETLAVCKTSSWVHSQQPIRSGTMSFKAIHPSSFQSYSQISSHGVECIHASSLVHSLPPLNLTPSPLVGRIHFQKSHIAR